MSGRKIDAYMLDCRHCHFEGELLLIDSVEAVLLAEKGTYYCFKCGWENDLPKEVA